jgi:hypothetical protein
VCDDPLVVKIVRVVKKGRLSLSPGVPRVEGDNVEWKADGWSKVKFVIEVWLCPSPWGGLSGLPKMPSEKKKKGRKEKKGGKRAGICRLAGGLGPHKKSVPTMVSAKVYQALTIR